MTDGHRIPQDGGDLIRSLQRRLTALERRGGVTNIDAHLGHGIAPKARQVPNWNDVTILQNGWYYSATDSGNSPDSTKAWTGQVICTSDGHGIMELWDRDITAVANPARYQRQFYYPGAPETPLFSAWTPVDSGWRPYTPTLTDGTIGTGGSLTGRYVQIGETIHFESRLILGTGFVFNSNTVVGTPTNTNPLHIYGALINVRLLQATNTYVVGSGILWSTGVSCYYMTVSGTTAGWTASISTTAPFTWKATDEVLISGTYRRA